MYVSVSVSVSVFVCFGDTDDLLCPPQRVKRELKKVTAQHDAVKALLPMSRSEVKDMEADLRLHQGAAKAKTARTKELRQEVDVFIHNFLKQEGVEAGKQETLKELLAAQEELELEQDQWHQEEALAQKQIAALRAQKTLRDRELKQVQQRHKSNIDELRMKELTLMDLTKQDGEVRNKLKQFSKLYEVVKTERNAYVNAIQSSSQALAEMKERIKILCVFVLPGGWGGWSLANARRCAACHATQAQRSRHFAKRVVSQRQGAGERAAGSPNCVCGAGRRPPGTEPQLVRASRQASACEAAD